MASASRNLMKALVLFRMLINNVCLAVRIVYIHHIGAGLVVTRINLMLHTESTWQSLFEYSFLQHLSLPVPLNY